MTKISTSLTRFSYASLLLLLCILCTLQKEHAVEANLDSQNIIHTHTLKVTSLLDSDVCDRSSQGFKTGSSLEVVHSYGPCNQAKAGNGPSTVELLRQDRLRSDSIQASLGKKSGSGSVKQTKATLPTQSGSAIGLGTSNYVVTLGLGTPKKNLSLVFDTAKDLTWTQCEPCTGGCSPQKGPKFDPAKSASYKNISCSSSLCDLADKQGDQQNCTSTTCNYGYSDGDVSSYGFFASDTLTVGSSDVVKNFLFGCGHKNEGTYGSAAGFLGLSNSPVSFVSQTATKYNKLFSYCIPSSSSSVGHLTFGGPVPANTKFTPSKPKNQFFSSRYFVNITAVSVGGRKLDIDESIFTESGTIIDSGTVLSKMQPGVHYRISQAFKELMKDYPLTDGYSIQDTPCYDLRGYDTIEIPKISFFFQGGAEVQIPPSGILFPIDGLEKVCLAFESVGGDEEDALTASLGTAQLRTYTVVVDAGKGRVGFAAGGCN